MERLPEWALARVRLARNGPQNRYFRQNSRGREKTRDGLAEDAVTREPFSAQFPANRD